MKFSEVTPTLSDETLDAISSFGFVNMTPVQAATIPLFLQHKDVCVEATTGSGKTLSFGIPIFEILSRQTSTLAKFDAGAMILAPTRELATQIYEVLNVFTEKYPQWRCILLIGGTSVTTELSEYKEHGGQIIIGTPGRILDFRNRSTDLNFKKLEVLVLDEADKLLDMGFKDAITQILSFLPKQRRTGLFSATQTQEVNELARVGLRNPVTVTVKVQHNTLNKKGTNMAQVQQIIPTTLSNWYITREYDDRPATLAQFIRHHLKEKIIVFCATCACVDYYADVFNQMTRKSNLSLSSSSDKTVDNILPENLPIIAFHGKMVAKKRSLLFKKFKALTDGGVMFSTDVAARGIDIPDVDWIVQWTAPKDPAFFIHRIGRTARAGRRGGALIFLAKEEEPYVELLRGRGAPLQNGDECMLATNSNMGLWDPELLASEGDDIIATTKPILLDTMKSLMKQDRALLEAGSTAFISFIRAYKEHLCSFIFRLLDLDIAAVARSYALLRLPKISETRGVKGKPILFDTDPIDTSKIPYKRKEQELARQRKLKESIEKAEQEAKAIEEGNIDGNEDGDSDNDDHRSKRSRITQSGEKGKKAWVPAEDYQRVEEKRKRKKKQSYVQKFREDWDDIAIEEALYKKFKKGKISKQQFEELSNSDKPLTMEEIDALGEKKKGKKRAASSDEDGDDSGSDSE